jgi:predicted transcriptional regulator of viral defense system
MKLQEYINSLHQAGKAAFTSAEALKAMNITREELAAAVLRLKKKGYLVKPYRDLYVPIPPEYRSLGCLPADQLLPPLMRHINTSYYVCLLSAAAFHGAAHQRPQITQVMVAKRIRPIRCGSVVIKFIYKKELNHVPTQLINVRTGYLTVSSPEATAMDLLLYLKQSGGINHIATILTELIEAIDPENVLQLANSSNEIVWVQRLGFLLETIEPLEKNNRDMAVKLLSEYIHKIAPAYAMIVPGKIKGFPRNEKWRVIVNTEIESDI